MNPFKKHIVFLFLVLLGLIACNTKAQDPTTITNRSFLMGFTTFPFDNTQEAQDLSFQYAIQNGDVLLAHFDHGVPWNEALNELPFPNEVQNAINGTIAASNTGTNIVLTATAINLSRDGLADYWNDQGSHQDLPSPWDTYSFNSPDVITAYLNYCKRIIDTIQPDYFGYGIEVNAQFQENTTAFNNYVAHANSIYSSLKQMYPDLPVFLTFQDQSFNKTQAELHQLTEVLLEYSDIIAVSTYPFWLYELPNQDANPALFSDNWLKQMRDLAPDKPFAVSETGYIAESLSITDFGVDVLGAEQWQADYVQKLCAEANTLDAEFVLWFIYRDYDFLYNNTPNPSPILKIWRDNGLLNGDGNRRISHDIWDNWLGLSHN